MQQVEVDGDITKSILTWHVRREDSGRQLVCRVSNPWFPAYTLEDSVLLDVMCKYTIVTRLHDSQSSHFGALVMSN